MDKNVGLGHNYKAGVKLKMIRTKINYVNVGAGSGVYLYNMYKHQYPGGVPHPQIYI